MEARITHARVSGRFDNMATSIRPLALLAVLVISVGWDCQTCASAQFVKGGGVRGSLKGGNGSSLLYSEELEGDSAGSGGTKELSSVEWFLGGTKGSATMTKGSLASLGTKGRLRSQPQGSSIEGNSFMAKQALNSGFKGVQASASSQQARGFVKGSLGLSGQKSQRSTDLKGAKASSRLNGALDSQWSKGSVKGVALGASKQTQQNFGLKGAKAGQELWSKGLTKGGSSTSMKKTQRSTGSDSFKGGSGSPWGTKGFVKGSPFGTSGQSQQLGSLQDGGASLRGLQESRFAKAHSFDSLQDKQQSAATKGLKGGSGLLRRDTNQGSRRMALEDDTRQPWTRSVKGGASRFGGMSGGTEQTQQSSLKRMAHQARFSSFKATGIMRAVQRRPGQQIGFAQKSFSGRRWGSEHGLGASGQSFSGQFQQSGAYGLLHQQRHALTAGQQRTLRGDSDPSQQLQLGTVQGQQRTAQLQRGSALTDRQKSAGQISKSTSMSRISKIKQASQQAIAQQSPSPSLESDKSLMGQFKSPSISILADVKFPQKGSPVQASQTSATGALSGQLSIKRASDQLSKQSVAIPGLSSAAVSLQTAAQQLQRTKDAGMKTSFSLGSLSSASQQKSAKGFLQQQQQQQQQQQ